MKKLSIFLACMVAVLAFNSCSQDTDPRYTCPTEFKLNTPALAAQYYELTPGGTIELTWSQPDYGYAAVANYRVQVSQLEDFGASLADPTTGYVELDKTYTVCRAEMEDAMVAEALCKLRGITTEDEWVDEDAKPLYVRVVSELSGVESSKIISNVIKLDRVKGYMAIQSPGYIYLVGAPEGWAGPTEANAEHYAPWRLFESSTAIGSKVYSGVFDIPAGSAMFRFYTALTGWDDDSYGSQADDNPLDITLTDGIYEGSVMKGKGSFNIPDWEGGKMKITVNLNNNTIVMEAGGIDTNGKAFIYLVGAPEGWAGPSADNAAHYEDWKLYDLEDNGVYTGTFDIAAGQAQFRFYSALNGWEDATVSIGSQEGDSPIDIALTDGVYTGASVAGKGSWNIPDWAGGKMAISVDTNSNTVTFTQK